MDLQLASAWLEHRAAGFSDIHQFAVQCQTAARTASRESAALALLAERAATFNERYEGIAVSSATVDAFIRQLVKEAAMLREASTAGDAEFVAALNAFAARLAGDLSL